MKKLLLLLISSLSIGLATSMHSSSGLFKIYDFSYKMSYSKKETMSNVTSIQCINSTDKTISVYISAGKTTRSFDLSPNSSNTVSLPYKYSGNVELRATCSKLIKGHFRVYKKK